MENIELIHLIQNLMVTPPTEKTEFSDNINWIDQLCSLVNLIPMVGGAFASEIQSLVKTSSEYRTTELLRKFTCLILELEDLSPDMRRDFLNEIEITAEDSSGNLLVNMVDRLDNINKCKILANLIRAKADKQISITDFFRLAAMLDRIPYVDLVNLPLYLDDYYDFNGGTELLYATGALQQTIIDCNEGDKFKLSILGVKFLRYGCGITVEEYEYPSGTMSMNALVVEPYGEK